MRATPGRRKAVRRTISGQNRSVLHPDACVFAAGSCTPTSSGDTAYPEQPPSTPHIGNGRDATQAIQTHLHVLSAAPFTGPPHAILRPRQNEHATAVVRLPLRRGGVAAAARGQSAGTEPMRRPERASYMVCVPVQAGGEPSVDLEVERGVEDFAAGRSLGAGLLAGSARGS